MTVLALVIGLYAGWKLRAAADELNRVLIALDEGVES